MARGSGGCDGDETPVAQSPPNGQEVHDVEETLRTLIAGVAAGAAEGAEALRSRGIAVELDAYSVEAKLDSAAPVASVRVDFV
ncbi:MAG TPA: hypothetical protein VFY15_02310, partial [Acidimicrobiia bacterium]|nr:hypothetical protein [Acidimicrobiia bacterium]